MLLPNNFFDQDAAQVAKLLLGKVIRHYYQGIWLCSQIIETEAYYLHEKASHASLGFTEKRKALFMPPGTIYMYHSRAGDSLNISCQGAGNAVLIKAGIPYLETPKKEAMLAIMQQLNPPKKFALRENLKLCAGQALLCRALGLKIKDWDQKKFSAKKFYIDDVGYQPQKIITTTRLGIATHRDAHLPLRFVDQAYVAYCSKKITAKTPHQIISPTKKTPLKNLMHLKVLITRTYASAQTLIAAIQTAGGAVNCLPTFVIAAPRHPHAFKKILTQLNNFDLAIFTSVAAVESTFAYHPQMPTHLTIAAIGPATAKALQRHQLNIHLLAKKNFTSETLAALPALKKVRHKKIIIFTGEAGRTWLAETLQKRKAQVTLAYAYQRLLPDDKMLRHWLQPAPGQTLEAARSELLRATHLIISYSNNSLENLAILFKKQQDCLIHKPILVISKRMQIFAQQLGFTQIITAKTATDSAVLRALKLWYSTHF